MMRLVYLVPNAAWVFLLGNSLFRMGDGPMVHLTRKDAVSEAFRCGLIVSESGKVAIKGGP